MKKEDRNLLLMLAGTALFIVIAGIALNGLPGSILPQKQKQKTEKTVLVGETEVKVEVADTRAKRAKGLSGVEELGKNEGMLFVFEEKDLQEAFWMKGMLIPIDIIWINDDQVLEIDAQIQPPKSGTKDKDLKHYAPASPYDYVLEVQSGFCSQNNIEVNDEVDLSQAL